MSGKMENQQPIIYFIFLYNHPLLPELEVCHGHAGAIDVALAAAAGHAVQPAHVDAAAAPE